MSGQHHDNMHRPARMTTGSPYVPNPASTGLCNTMSCIRCGQHRPLSQLVADARVRNQRRCAGGCAGGAGFPPAVLKAKRQQIRQAMDYFIASDEQQ